MCNYRDYHEITRGNLDWNFNVQTVEGGCRIEARAGAAPFWLTTSHAAELTHTGVWYWNFVYRREVERGFPEREDLYLPGVFRAVLQPGESVTLIAATEPPEATAALIEGALERENTRQQGLLKQAGFKNSGAEPADPTGSIEAFAAQLVTSADQFMVKRELKRQGEHEEVPTVLAGYHWFTDWGRDTMIALPGLSLPTGRAREANRILRAFGLFSREGLIPNQFPDAGGPPIYNTADATLWMFAAVEALAEGTGNLNKARDLYPLLADMVAWHVRGTRYGIKMDPEDSLLQIGEEGVQLTWMDAKVDDWVVTERRGKAVEINALWYNALKVIDKLRISLGRTVVAGREEPPDFAALAEQVRYSFRKRLWYDAGGYLFDVIDGPGGNDISIRPNQIIAAGMRDLISPDQARQVLTVVRQQLLTPYGLRTLAQNDPLYRGKYRGDRHERDAAYHNGTVWTWLLGPYFNAVSFIEGREAATNELKRMLPALQAHMLDAGLGSISEIFDGDAPHEPQGCISQAWSVAAVLRLVWGNDSLV
ncbi:MAG: amylo-alpha-1,6-glucosidase, partial [Chloroflexota bacterium]|nr:amylo-alpha-1,6-glucosidase [Chloroflexota bacterium]